MSLLGRLVSGTILVLILAIGVLVWAAEGSLRRDLERDLATGLEREARLIATALPIDSLGARAAVHRFSAQNGHRITLIDSTGRVLAESGVPDASVSAMENHLHRPEVQAALAGRVGTDIRMSATFGVVHLYVAVAGGPGVVRVAAPYELVDATVHRAQAAVVWAALIALGAGLLLALFAGRSIARPLTEITQAANAIAAGRPPRFPHSGIPDVDALVGALREMHGQLNDRFEQLRREQAETSAVIGSMVEGVVAADSRGRVVTANTALRRLLGYRDDEPLPELPQLFRAKAARDVVDAVMRGEAIDGREVELEGRTLLATARPLPQGGVVLVLHDLTEVRRLEAVRRDFVANVSHELKTPLTSISGYAETLVSDKPDAATAERFLEVILGNARRMQRLVDSLLDLSRIESGSWRPTLEQIDLGIAARETWAGLAARAATAGVGFELDLEPGRSPLIGADADALRQVLTNLFDNALRYTPRGGKVVCRLRRADGGNVLSVVDNGSGIPREHLTRVFERFYRADPSRSRDEGGTGLGLSIVKHLVEAHGGRVWAESELGSGTTISAFLPDAVTPFPTA
jgi:signal transduction histidine kinase